jgi:hypothetical protein
MRAAIIVDTGINESLLRFTETKLFFDAKNKNRNLVDDCFIAASESDALILANTLIKFETIFIIKSGYYLTTTFDHKHKTSKGIILVDEVEGSVIKYDPDTYIGFNKRCNYPPLSKQLYIVENMLKAIISAKKSVYLENTENLLASAPAVDHLYGLASGWKTFHLAKLIGFENLKSITVYDINPLQLEYAKKLHASPTIPISVDDYKNKHGTYLVPDWITQELWDQWHSYPVKFEVIDLLSTPTQTFLSNSLIWVSNVFKFEPTIFQYGWQNIKEAKSRLLLATKASIIIYYTQETNHGKSI